MNKEQKETALALVAEGFTYKIGHRFVLYHGVGPREGQVSGGGTALKATYGPFLLPDLDDPTTASAIKEWVASFDNPKA